MYVVSKKINSVLTNSMTAVLFLLYACGFLNNAFLFFWVYNYWSSSKRLNKIVLVQLFLNTWNIITHAAVEFTKQRIWIIPVATSFSFFSIYSLVAVVLSTALGKPMQQRLNSKLNIIIFTLISSTLLVFYGRRYEHCESDNCFSTKLAKTEDEMAILKSDITLFYAPTAVIFFGSWYLGFRTYNRMAVLEPRRNCTKRLSFHVCSNMAVSLFILYGLFIIYGILYFTDEVQDEISMANHLCRMSCLHEELYVLLSMFPVYMAYFIKQNERI